MTAQILCSLVNNSKYVAALSFFCKACTKGYVVNSCLANPAIQQPAALTYA